MLYNPLGPELIEGRSRARRLMATFNAPLTLEASAVKIVSQRTDIIHDLFCHVGKSIYIEPPLWITAAILGSRDQLSIPSDDCWIGPNVTILAGVTIGHGFLYRCRLRDETRYTDLECCSG
ncbi:galactoside O-acetyltransferase [Penicillium sp. IBT 31633x]|nr:galactoside O-acetyltransferase [Penicillium sp. IBT 31633x]